MSSTRGVHGSLTCGWGKRKLFAFHFISSLNRSPLQKNTSPRSVLHGNAVDEACNELRDWVMQLKLRRFTIDLRQEWLSIASNQCPHLSCCFASRCYRVGMASRIYYYVAASLAIFKANYIPWANNVIILKSVSQSTHKARLIYLAEKHIVATLAHQSVALVKTT